MNVLNLVMAYMMTKLNMVRALGKDEKGVTAMEYALIAALVAVVIITVLTTIGTNANARFTTIANALGVAAPAK